MTPWPNVQAGLVTGLGGAVGQSPVGAVSIAGDYLRRLSRVPVRLRIDFTLTGDGQAIHTEKITDQAQKRLNYADRQRLWQSELRGNATLTQFDLASSFTEMHTGN